MKKVLYLIHDCDFFISHRLGLAKCAKEMGYEVHLAAPLNIQAWEVFSTLGFTVHEINASGGFKGIFLEFKTFFKIFCIVKKIRPDVIHSIYIKMVLMGGFCGRLLKVHRVINAVTGLGHLFVSNSLKAKIMRFFTLFFLRYTLSYKGSVLLVQNQNDAETFTTKKYLGVKNCVVMKGTGINLDRYTLLPEPNAPITVLFPGRFIKEKGIFEFYEAAKKIKSKNKDVIFAIVGKIHSANPSSVTESTLNQWIRDGVIENWGWTEDMPNILQKVHIVCLPSYREGTPRVLLEAAACGKPIVTTNVPGCRDIIEPGINGLVVDLFDETALVNALNSLIEDKGLRQRLGKNGRDMIEKEYEERNFSKKICGLYEN